MYQHVIYQQENPCLNLQTFQPSEIVEFLRQQCAQLHAKKIRKRTTNFHLEMERLVRIL